MGMPSFEFAHVGLNHDSEMNAEEASELFKTLFGLSIKEGNSSFFAGPNIELTKSIFPGEHGHIGILTPDIPSALTWLAAKGVAALPETEKMRDGEVIAVYLNLTVSGFAIHLLKG